MGLYTSIGMVWCWQGKELAQTKVGLMSKRVCIKYQSCDKSFPAKENIEGVKNHVSNRLKFIARTI